MTFGQHLRKLRLEHGLYQVELARRVGLTQSFVGKLERGMHAPEMHVLRRLIAALEVKDVGRFVRLAVLAGVPADLQKHCKSLSK